MADWTARERLFLEQNMGKMTVPEMAAHLGKGFHQVKGALRRLRLRLRAKGWRVPSRYRTVAELEVRHGERLEELHRQGYSDPDIARKIKELTTSQVWKLRNYMGLPSNCYNDRFRKKVSAAAREMLQFRCRSFMEAERRGWPGLTAAQARVLDALADGPLDRCGLAGKLNIKWWHSPSGLKNRVDGLIALGYVEKEGDLYRLAAGCQRQGVREEEEDEETEGEK